MLTLEEEWVLVVSGLIAHADGVLEAEECDRLLGMLGEEVAGEVYSEWLTFFSDLEAMRRRYDSLHNPTPAAAKDILEQAWAMVLVDGEEAADEVRVLHEIAGRLGIEPKTIEAWRHDWDARLDDFAELVAELASFVLSGTGPLPEADRNVFANFVDRLPTNVDHREELRAMLVLRCRDDLGPKVGELGPRQRDQSLRLLAPLAHDAVDDQGAQQRYILLSQAAGVSVETAARVLEATR